MVFPSLGNHFSRETILKNIFHIGRDFGMIAYSKRIGRSLRESSKEVVMRDCLLSVRQGKMKEF
jgi:hypothetical protein